MSELPLGRAVCISGIKIVHALEVIGKVNHSAGLCVEIKSVDVALAGCDRRELARSKIHLKDLRLAFHNGFESNFSVARPVQIRRNEIEIFHEQPRWSATARGGNIQLRELAPRRLAGE